MHASESLSILRTVTCSLTARLSRSQSRPSDSYFVLLTGSTCRVWFLTVRRRLTQGYKAFISHLSVTSDTPCTQICKLSLLLQSSVGVKGCFMVCSVRCDSRYARKGKKPERERERGGVWGVRRRAGPCRHFLEVSVTLKHHRCTFTQQEMRLLHQCFLTFVERLDGFSRNPLPNTHTQFLSFSNHMTQVQEPAPKIHTSCALQVCSSTPACTVDPPPPTILSSGRWESLCFGFPACPCLGAVLPEINMFILIAFWLCFNDLFETDNSHQFT